VQSSLASHHFLPLRSKYFHIRGLISVHELKISVGTAIHVIHKKVLMFKVSSCWVPLLLKRHYSESFDGNLEDSKQDADTFFFFCLE
jgi:hypothetical protein